MSREDILKMLSLPRKYTNPQIPPLASQLPVSVDATEMSVAVPVAVPVAPSEVAPTLDIQSTNAANADTKKRHVNVRSWIDSHPDDSSFETYIVWCFQDDVRQIPVTDAYFNTVLKEALQSKNKLPESSTVSLYDQLKVDATMTATRSRARVRARTIPDDAEVQSAREKLKYDSSTTSKVDSDTTPTAKRVTTPSGKVNVSLKYRRLLIDAIYRNLESKYQSLNRSQMFALAANLENHLYVTVDSIFAYMDTVTLKSRLEVARDALKHMQMNMLTPMTGSLTPYRGKMCQPQAALQPDILAHSMQSSEPHSSQFSFDVNEDDDSEYRDDSEYEISGHY